MTLYKRARSWYNGGRIRLERRVRVFNVGMAEIILLLLIAFVVVGPKDLPKVARALGRFVRYIRKMVEEVKRETGFDEVAKDFKDMEKAVDESVRQMDVRPQMQKTQLEINKELSSVKKELSFKDFKNNANQNHMGGKGV